jgi:hypothetical protein
MEHLVDRGGDGDASEPARQLLLVLRRRDAPARRGRHSNAANTERREHAIDPLFQARFAYASSYVSCQVFSLVTMGYDLSSGS